MPASVSGCFRWRGRRIRTRGAIACGTQGCGKTARRWNLKEFWLETVAAQNILKFYLDERSARENIPLVVNELPYDNSENAKKNRIESLEPLIKNHQMWCHRSQEKFVSQIRNYPGGLVDVLDTLGYGLKIMSISIGPSAKEMQDWLKEQEAEFASRGSGSAGY